MIKVGSKGNFNNTERFLKNAAKLDIASALNKIGQLGVRVLSSATPVDSSQTANSWSYDVQTSRSSSSITWTNSHMAGGVPVVILLQYGHGTGTGGYVQGRDFINPAIKPVMDRIADDVWKVVTSA